MTFFYVGYIVNVVMFILTMALCWANKSRIADVFDSVLTVSLIALLTAYANCIVLVAFCVFLSEIKRQGVLFNSFCEDRLVFINYSCEKAKTTFNVYGDNAETIISLAFENMLNSPDISESMTKGIIETNTRLDETGAVIVEAAFSDVHHPSKEAILEALKNALDMMTKMKGFPSDTVKTAMCIKLIITGAKLDKKQAVIADKYMIDKPYNPLKAEAIKTLNNEMKRLTDDFTNAKLRLHEKFTKDSEELQSKFDKETRNIRSKLTEVKSRR